MYAYAQPYRDPTNPNHVIPKWQKDMAQWCNKRMIFCTTDFKDFMPRKGFTGVSVDHSVNGIVGDKAGNIWIGTDRMGLIRKQCTLPSKEMGESLFTGV